MQNLFIKIRCVSRKQSFFSCCVVCISMTPECWGQYALENKDCIPSAGADRLYTVSQVYRLPARTVTSRSDGIPQSGAYGSLRKVGIPSSGVQRVKLSCEFLLISSHLAKSRCDIHSDAFDFRVSKWFILNVIQYDRYIVYFAKNILHGKDSFGQCTSYLIIYMSILNTLF